MEKITSIKSKRNTDINVTIIESDVLKPGLVIMAHGFKANRSEDGRFITVGKKLAEFGINTIMMGFAGCDESKEDFINYSISSCLDDIDSCYEYMKANYDIDTNRIGMIGYSMGGRLTSIFIDSHKEIKVIGIWAGACFDREIDDEFLGENIRKMSLEANTNGYFNYLNFFDNTYLKLSKEFIDDITNYKPSVGLTNFKGSAIVVHGDNDDTVLPSFAELTFNNLINAKDKKMVIVKGANHGFGAWDNHFEQSKELTDVTIEFFLEHLK